ncbi:MAG: hypothetical protein ACLTW9_03175 [Enterocloster sp.]
MKTETIRKKPVMRSRLMPERLKQGQGEDGQEGGEGDGSAAAGGRHGRVKRFVYVFAGSAGILLSANLGVGLLKRGRGEKGLKGLVRRWRRKG